MLPSLVLYRTLFEDVLRIPKLKTPLPVTALVTSSSIQLPELTEPASARGEPVMTGALLQVTPSSVHGELEPS